MVEIVDASFRLTEHQRLRIAQAHDVVQDLNEPVLLLAFGAHFDDLTDAWIRCQDHAADGRVHAIR